MSSRFTDYKADAPTTTPSFRLDRLPVLALGVVALTASCFFSRSPQSTNVMSTFLGISSWYALTSDCHPALPRYLRYSPLPHTNLLSRYLTSAPLHLSGYSQCDCSHSCFGFLVLGGSHAGGGVIIIITQGLFFSKLSTSSLLT